MVSIISSSDCSQVWGKSLRNKTAFSVIALIFSFFMILASIFSLLKVDTMFRFGVDGNAVPMLILIGCIIWIIIALKSLIDARRDFRNKIQMIKHRIDFDASTGEFHFHQCLPSGEYCIDKTAFSRIDEIVIYPRKEFVRVYRIAISFTDQDSKESEWTLPFIDADHFFNNVYPSLWPFMHEGVEIKNGGMI